MADGFNNKKTKNTQFDFKKYKIMIYGHTEHCTETEISATPGYSFHG
jgi:hypothetical protein